MCLVFMKETLGAVRKFVAGPHMNPGRAGQVEASECLEKLKPLVARLDEAGCEQAH